MFLTEEVVRFCYGLKAQQNRLKVGVLKHWSLFPTSFRLEFFVKTASISEKSKYVPSLVITGMIFLQNRFHELSDVPKSRIWPQYSFGICSKKSLQINIYLRWLSPILAKILAWPKRWRYINYFLTFFIGAIVFSLNVVFTLRRAS